MNKTLTALPVHETGRPFEIIQHGSLMVSGSRRIFKTEPFYSPRPWGYELWTLSTHPAGQSKILPEKESLNRFLPQPLPLLIKIIKADQPLSVQVHPDDEYARIHENDSGKTECWYILEAKPNARLIAGIKPGLCKETMARVLKEGRLEEVVNYINVQAGDMIFIPAGTVHAIMGGLKLIEIQQSSDATYRMYDWGRDREMHIEKSLDVIDYGCCRHAGKIEHFSHLETGYFNVEKVRVDVPISWHVEEDFETINVISGQGGIITDDGQGLTVDAEQTVYIPKGVTYTVIGNLEILRT